MHTVITLAIGTAATIIALIAIFRNRDGKDRPACRANDRAGPVIREFVVDRHGHLPGQNGRMILHDTHGTKTRDHTS